MSVSTSPSFIITQACPPGRARVGGMRAVKAACIRRTFIGIAVVCRRQRRRPRPRPGVTTPCPRTCPRLHGSHYGGANAGVAHHVAVGSSDDIVLAAFSCAAHTGPPQALTSGCRSWLWPPLASASLPFKASTPPLKKKVPGHFSASVRSCVLPRFGKVLPSTFVSACGREGHAHVGHGGVIRVKPHSAPGKQPGARTR